MQAFPKTRNLVKISKISKNLEILKVFSREARPLYELFEREPGWRFTARCHTKTIAKRARVEPRTQVHVTMKIFIQVVIANDQAFVNFGICFRSCDEVSDVANTIEK